MEKYFKLMIIIFSLVSALFLAISLIPKNPYKQLDNEKIELQEGEENYIRDNSFNYNYFTDFEKKTIAQLSLTNNITKGRNLEYYFENGAILFPNLDTKICDQNNSKNNVEIYNFDDDNIILIKSIITYEEFKNNEYWLRIDTEMEYNIKSLGLTYEYDGTNYKIDDIVEEKLDSATTYYRTISNIVKNEAPIYSRPNLTLSMFISYESNDYGSMLVHELKNKFETTRKNIKFGLNNIHQIEPQFLSDYYLLTTDIIEIGGK